MRSNISRRSFITGGALGVLGAATIGITGCAPQPSSSEAGATESEGELSATGGHSWETTPEPIDESAIADTSEADVIVVGAGISGFSVACSAIDEGLKVIMIAKGERPAGQGGSMFGFNSKLCRELGVNPDPGEVLRDLYAVSGYSLDENLWSIYVKESGVALDWACDIARNGGLTPVIAAGDPRDEYDGEHMFLGGENGPRTDTHPIIDFLPIMEAAYAPKGLDVRYKMCAVSLDKQGERVTGVVAQDENGTYHRFTGTKGVVMATGDFAGNPEMLEAWCPMGADEAILNVSPGNTGDGHALILQAGGALEHTAPLAPMVFSNAMGGPSAKVGPDEVRDAYANDPAKLELFDCAKEAIFSMNGSKWCLGVTDKGERYGCEQGGFGQRGIQQVRYGGHSFNIYDSEWPYHMPEIAGRVGGHVSTGEELAMVMCPEGKGYDTLDELAADFGIPADTLKATVERYNALCEAGYDEDFYKPADQLHPVKTPPFYCDDHTSMLLVTMGGIRTDSDMHVLNENDEIVEGLYCNGTMAGGMFANSYVTVMPGVNMGRSLTFGYRLGKHLASL